MSNKKKQIYSILDAANLQIKAPHRLLLCYTVLQYIWRQKEKGLSRKILLDQTQDCSKFQNQTGLPTPQTQEYATSTGLLNSHGQKY